MYMRTDFPAECRTGRKPDSGYTGIYMQLRPPPRSRMRLTKWLFYGLEPFYKGQKTENNQLAQRNNMIERSALG